MEVEKTTETYLDLRLAVVGLGYVGLPLAVEFAKTREVIGFDISTRRIMNLKNGYDATSEVDKAELLQVTDSLTFTSDPTSLAAANCFIITVPTPIDASKSPNLGPLQSACREVGKWLKTDDIVIFESTVYPGCTEEECIPILEEVSSLQFNRDFYAGYSPERINPGDKNHGVRDIVKVTSGSTHSVACVIDDLYRSIIEAGTFKASSIRVAEAAKVIENSQRDLNIAFINELLMLFDAMDINTHEVLAAAKTKWNFLGFRPGLVGGHCIGVDPYYLTHKAKSIGFYPETILAGRRVNDGMAKYHVSQAMKLIIKRGISIAQCRVLVIGLTFKEDCPDIRNSKSFDVISEFEDFGCTVDVIDPLIGEEDVESKHLVNIVKSPRKNHYHIIFIAVGHKSVRNWGIEKIKSWGQEKTVVYDFKNIFAVDSELIPDS